jgi:hypothetical protein
VLLRGPAGPVVGTDGRQLLIQSGFSFPWQGDMLVPRLAVWGCPELAGEGPPSVGRTDSHVFVRAGPWTLALAADANGRFPSYEAVLPRMGAGSGPLQLGPDDVAVLLKELPRLARDSEAPVTLVLGPRVCLQPQAGEQGPAEPLWLPTAGWAGPSWRVVMHPRYLLRAMRLGFTAVAVARPDRPLVCRDATRTYLWMPLAGDDAPAPPNNKASQVAAGPPAPLHDSPEPTKEVPAMPNPTNNGQLPGSGGDPAPPPVADPLEEAEAVRALLAEAQSRLGRLVAALKLHRRQSRAVAAAVASLRQLPPLSP